MTEIEAHYAKSINTCSTEYGAKEKAFLEEKIAGAIPFIGPESSGKNN